MNRRRGEGPWWITEIAVPLALILAFLVVMVLGGTLTGS